MSSRRSHYELAFEKYLLERGTPFVAVEDARHFVKGRLGTKAFDYIVYPREGQACLVDVKGRKTVRRSTQSDCRQKNWVTRADLHGLQAWESVFGPGYTGMFVFGYWLAEGGGGRETGDAGPKPEVIQFAGRRYSFWTVSLAEYARHQRQLSKRWDTIAIPREVFRRLSRRLEVTWPAASCS